MAEGALEIAAADGLPLHLRTWSPEPPAAARGVLHIAHGLAEHGGRYAPLGRTLAGRGWIVHANDHRGHGLTARPPGTLGHFADSNGWRLVVDDLAGLLRRHRAAHPGLPLVLLGHSMGSFMAQQLLYEAPELLDAVILSGSNGKPLRLASFGRLVARLVRRLNGPRGSGRLLARLSFDGFNRRFAPTRTRFDWLSRDAAAVDAYIADPLCGFDGTPQLWIDLLDALPALARPANQERIPPDMPVLVISGDADPVGDNLSQLVAAYRTAGLERLTVKLYPEARHELLNETNRDEVVVDLAAWLDSLSAAPRPRA